MEAPLGFVLTEAEARVLGCLIEKDLATPEYYPLSLNALVNACNQKSNRDPVVAYGEDEVALALDGLRNGPRLASRITGQDMRVPKFAHRVTEVWNLTRPETALLATLLLRGAQTVGELRGRTDRMYTFDDTETVERCLERLEQREPGAMVRKLPRLPGQKDSRYAHTLRGEPAAEAPAATASAPAPASGRLAELEQEVAALRYLVGELRRDLDEFRARFG
ncbi:MAG: DUF480 domain-containing protein [Acidobacteria bacterium]|nr:DUF480 domain-containing protein [Acidobacteriota bacterium]